MGCRSYGLRPFALPILTEISVNRKLFCLTSSLSSWMYDVRHQGSKLAGNLSSCNKYRCVLLNALTPFFTTAVRSELEAF